MNDEIKEILSLLNSSSWSNETKQIEDYITNLQQENDDLKNRLENAVADCNLRLQENERLKELCDEYEEEHSNEFKIWKEERHELLDYKSRCKKASNKLSFIDEALENNTLNVPLCITKINSALNILQNESDDNE